MYASLLTVHIDFMLRMSQRFLCMRFKLIHEGINPPVPKFLVKSHI